MNKLGRFINALGRVPIVPLIGFPGTRLTGVSIKQALFDPHAQVDALLALHEAVQPDALFAMMDLTVEAEFLGCELKIADDDPPTVADGVLKNQSIPSSVFANKITGGRMPLFADVVAELKKALAIPVGAYVTGPLTLAGQLMDIAGVMKATRKNPDMLHLLLSGATQVIMNYAALLESAGADIICILEPSAVMISSAQFQEFSGRYCSQIISQSVSGISILHICGDTNHLIGEMEKTGSNGLSLDKQVDLPNTCQTLQPDTVLIGNLDPVSVLTLDDADAVRRKSRELLDAMNGKDNFILSTGCDVPPNAPIENIQSMMAAGRNK